MASEPGTLPLAPSLAARRPPAWAAPAVCAFAIAITLFFRLVLYQHRVMPIAFGIPLVLFGWLRSRRYLWITAASFAAMTIFKFFLILSLYPNEGGPAPLPFGVRVIDASMVLFDMFVIAIIVHVLIGVREWLETRNADLLSANAELAHREEEIARQNEELQSQAEELQRQTEELERQSEELRVTNTDLAAREQTLETLLSLSRSLTTELTRGQTLEHICRAMGPLISGPGAASAILEQDGDAVVVSCHHGLGDDGPPSSQRIPTAQSFAGLVLQRGRSAYIEDLSLRPDLQVPQGKDGAPFRSILASPLRVGGWPVGTLEVYNRVAGPWSESQVALLESLAAQASVSLEAARLFEAMLHERRRLEAVLRAAPIGIAVASADARQIRVNPAGAALFGVPADANLAELGFFSSAETFAGGLSVTREDQPIVRAVLRGSETHDQELEMRLADGRHLILLVNAAPVRDAEGNIAGAVSTFTNITAQKELQRELDLRRREAEEASIRKTRFLAAVSHDIRTPANAISLLAELIRRTASNPAMASEVPELANELQGSAISLVNLLSDVLDVARFDSGKVELLESDFDLDTLLAEESRQMQPLAREKGLELEYVSPPAPIWLRIDRIKLSRVLGNLVGNAIKFTERGTIRVVADHDGNGDGAIAIRVSDTGIGIPQEHVRHIFDEFFQLRNPERDRNKGTGLGLTICKRLVDAMGGTLSVQSAPGEGSTFSVILPPSVRITAPASSL